MARDIDHAAIAVKTAITEKFGRKVDLNGLEVTAKERTIQVSHESRLSEGTRDLLITAIRKADSYDQFWASVPRIQGGTLSSET